MRDELIDGIYILLSLRRGGDDLNVLSSIHTFLRLVLEWI